MSESDKIISHKADLFILETSNHLIKYYDHPERYTPNMLNTLIQDMKRCIKILEDCKDAQ